MDVGDGREDITVQGKEKHPDTNEQKAGRCCGTNLLLYCSHALSAWGDRMWQFATGMFLIELSPGSLRLTATYGFTSGGAILLLGAIVGDLVDRLPRLKVARTALVLQNISVAISAIAVCLTIVYLNDIAGMWDGWLQTLCEVVIIVFAVVADVASVGRQISIERDWIVVICPDKQALTAMSAFLRRIDLTTNLLAPIVTGLVITYGSMTIGALFIAGWNLVSVLVEYGFLSAVYRSVPELAAKNIEKKKPGPEAEVCLSASVEIKNNKDEEERKRDPNAENNDEDDDGEEEQDETRRHKSKDEEEERIESEQSSLLENQDADSTYGTPEHSAADGDRGQGQEEVIVITETPTRSSKRGCCFLLLNNFITLYRGWKTYANQDILFAGLGLATLYMTVLGFDNITSGYAKDQGLSEAIVGVLMGCGAVVGILGTLAFPRLRARVGLERTGLFAFTFEVLCLGLCVGSVFAPGSPFNPGFLLSDAKDDVIDDVTFNVSGATYSTITSTNQPPPKEGVDVSIILLMTGIVISRSGLWMADLTVTQLLLECPKEQERGIVNGVQNSINKVMDLLKFVLVIVLPWPQTFGILVILSFLFIVLGGCLFAVYSRKVRGHLAPFHKYFGECEDYRVQNPENRLAPAPHATDT